MQSPFSVDNVLRNPRFSNISKVMDKLFKGKSIEDMKKKISFKSEKKIESTVDDLLRRKNMQKLDKLSEKYVSIPIIQQILKSEPNALGKADLKRKQQIGPTEDYKSILDEAEGSADMLPLSPKKTSKNSDKKLNPEHKYNKHAQVNQTDESHHHNFSKFHPVNPTSKINSEINYLVSISDFDEEMVDKYSRYPLDDLPKETKIRNKLLKNFSPEPGRYKPNYSSIFKNVPSVKFQKDNDSNIKLIADKIKKVQLDKMLNLKQKIVNKSIEKLERIKKEKLDYNPITVKKHLLSIDMYYRMDPSKRDRLINLKKGISFEKYSPRGELFEIKTDFTESPIQYESITPVNKQPEVKVLEKRYSSNKKSSHNLFPTTPAVGYYNPRFDLVEDKSFRHISYNKSSKKLSAHKVFSYYDVQSDYKTIKIKSTIDSADDGF